MSEPDWDAMEAAEMAGDNIDDLEAECARLRKVLEDQALATAQGRELVGPWIVECRVRREIMEWARDKLEKWEKLLALEADRATCRVIRMALSPDNPKLKGA